MVQNTLRWLLDSWQSLLNALSPLGLVILVVALVPVLVGLVRFVLERDGLTRSGGWLASFGPRALAWVPVAALVGVAFAGLTLARSSVLLRLDTQSQSAFSRLPDPPGGDTVQLNPKVAYTQEARYTRSIKIPSDVLKRFDQDGPEVLQQFISPYLAEPQSRNVRAYLDSIVRNGRSIYLVRESSILEERQIPLDTADVQVAFTTGETAAGRTFYRANFEGKYAFTNTQPEARDVRLRFPLPQNAGTLEAFEFRAGNDVSKVPNQGQEFVWERNLKPGERAEVSVKYRNQGSGLWVYRLGAGREPVKAFNLKLTAPGDVKFQRGALYPSTQSGSSYAWNLKDVITAQSVSLAFPDSGLRETITKIFSFMPLALPLCLLWSLAFSLRRGFRLLPWRALIGGLGFTLGLALSGVLIGYAPVWLACALGFALASGLGLLALGRDYALPVILSALTPFAFLSVGNAGLLLGIVAVVVVLSLLPNDALGRLRPPPARPMGSG